MNMNHEAGLAQSSSSKMPSSYLRRYRHAETSRWCTEHADSGHPLVHLLCTDNTRLIPALDAGMVLLRSCARCCIIIGEDLMQMLTTPAHRRRCETDSMHKRFFMTGRVMRKNTSWYHKATHVKTAIQTSKQKILLPRQGECM